MTGLLDKLDAAAVALLDAAFPDNSVPKGESDTEAGPPVTVAEKAKALAIAMTWYKERMEFHPPERTKGKGEALRDRFQRQQRPSQRRAGAGKATESDPDAEPSEPAESGDTNGVFGSTLPINAN